MSDMRKNTGMNPCLSQSNDISAPYILLCNYADATPKLVSSFQLAFLIYEHVSVMVRLRSEDLHQEIWRAGQLTISFTVFLRGTVVTVEVGPNPFTICSYQQRHAPQETKYS